LIRHQGVPVVVLDRRVSGVQVDVVRGDSEGGACELVRHLLDLGHQRIAVLTGPPGVSTAVDRVTGYHRALCEAGLNGGDELVFYGMYTQASGYDMARQALAMRPRPTALFGTNNFISIGALRAVRESGLRVPEDMALVSFDDLPASLLIDPFLTTAAQPAYEMGRRATELLLDRLFGRAPQQCQEILLPVKIVVRRSSGALETTEEVTL
jgi:LacI family transcriptional regulator